MAGANTTSYDLPPLPAYTLEPLPQLYSWISDAAITAALPVIGYWIVSLTFHLIDVYDLFPQYRLHTPAEVLKRNHVSRYEVLRDVVFQQIIQVIFSLGLAVFDEAPTTGKADYDVAWYAQKIRLAQRAVPYALSTIGLNPMGLATKVAESQPVLASVVMGGRYPELLQTVAVAGQKTLVPAFASWEMSAASFLYWFAIPAFQFAAAIVIIDAWEYMLHRAMHMNKWLYGGSRAKYILAGFTNITQSPSTHATTVSMSLTPTALFTTTHLRVLLSTRWVLALRICSPE
jgi:sphinganine C4-monooxygenase